MPKAAAPYPCCEVFIHIIFSKLPYKAGSELSLIGLLPFVDLVKFAFPVAALSDSR